MLGFIESKRHKKSRPDPNLDGYRDRDETALYSSNF